jgi:ribose 5-phosphate isomerase A
MEDTLARAAIAEIEAGMMVGLGTGRAASRCIRALAARNIEVRCVATSIRSAELAYSLGLRVEPFEHVRQVDFLFDGADEVDPKLSMIKGAGGAMTREKMVARAAKRRVYVIDASKLVERLGEKKPVPVEVLAFGLASVRASLERLGLSGEVRVDDAGRVLTDEGNPILDVALPVSLDPALVDEQLQGTPGVVGHGLFLSEADAVFIEHEDGRVAERRRGG